MEIKNAKSANLCDESAKTLLETEGRHHIYGVDRLEPGDEFIITPVSYTDAEGKPKEVMVTAREYNSNKYLNFYCTGDREIISFTALFGTPKVRKFFGPDSVFSPTFIKGKTFADYENSYFKAPYKKEDDLKEHLDEFKGRRFRCVASCVDDKTFPDSTPQTRYMFEEIKAK